MTSPLFAFDNSYARRLPGFYERCLASAFSTPSLVVFNFSLAEELGLGQALNDPDLAARIFSGAELPPGAEPLAQAYAGHQFGGFSPRLGDGRALLLGEVIDRSGHRRDIQLKGSGPTPFSRGGDGRAALGPMLREYMISESMAALNIPTTRSLAVVLTGESVYRDTVLPGAVLTRTAASHIRIGTFQYFAAQRDGAKLRQLADYTIARHCPDLQGKANPYLALFEHVRDLQAALVAQWMRVGFVHGVMNTDNAAVSGETIDYGPCAFMDRYDPATVFSSIDTQGRYSYGNQPALAGWNLARFAEALLPLFHEDERRAHHIATEALNVYIEIFETAWLNCLRAKLGLARRIEDDRLLVEELLAALQQAGADFTLSFRCLSKAARGDDQPFLKIFADLPAIREFLNRWLARLNKEQTNPQEVADAMDRTNPLYIPRNHLVEEALQASERRLDHAPFKMMLELLSNPFEEQEGRERYAALPPENLPPYRSFCGT